MCIRDRYAIQWLYQALYSFSPILGGTIVGGLWSVFVIFGAHRALLPIGLNDVAITGTNTLIDVYKRQVPCLPSTV